MKLLIQSLILGTLMTTAAFTTSDSDPFLWLEELTSSASTEWVKMQNATTSQVLVSDSRFLPLKENLKKLFSASDKLDQISLTDHYAYRFKTTKNHEIGIWERSPAKLYISGTPQWELLIDFDQLSKDSGIKWYLGDFSEYANDPAKILVGLSREGRDANVVREFDANSKQFVAGGFTLEEGKGNATWIDGNSWLITHTSICEQTTSGYARDARILERGSAPKDARLVFSTAPDSALLSVWTLDVEGKKMPILFEGVSFWDSNIYYFDERKTLQKIPSSSTKAVIQGEFEKSWIYLAKEDFVENGVQIPTGSIYSVEAFVHNPKVRILFAPAKNQSVHYIYVSETGISILGLEDVNGRLWQIDTLSTAATPVALPGNNLSVNGAGGNKTGALLMMEGFLTPPSLVYHNPKKGLQTLQQTPHRFDSTRLTTSQKFATSKDGTRIPYFVVHAKDLKLNSTNPTILYGYGGFESSEAPYYSQTYGLSWFEKGYVYVVANIRGGGEYGPAWHQAAILENKQKSYDDFIAVAEDLIQSKVTAPRHLGISGGSNGGLLVGAVTMQRPDLFNAALSANPLLDMIRYTKLSAGASWIGEYGDPDDPRMREFILKYSPYQNVSANKKYPKMLVTTALSDDRVHPGHARKFAAKMQSMGHETLFDEDTEGGHNQGTPESLAHAAAKKMMYFYQQLVD